MRLEEKKRITKTYIYLLILTFFLVSVSLLNQRFAVFCLLTITPIKASLIGYNYMHIRNESILIKGAIIFILLNIFVFFLLTFSDIAMR